MSRIILIFLLSNDLTSWHFLCLQYSNTFWSNLKSSKTFPKKFKWCNMLLPNIADVDLKIAFLRISAVMAKQTIQIPLNSTEPLVSVIINHSDGKVSAAWMKRTAGALAGDSYLTCRLAPQPKRSNTEVLGMFRDRFSRSLLTNSHLIC